MAKRVSVFLLLMVISIGVIIGVPILHPPSAPSESDAVFPAYERMLDNLKTMTVAPHPSGSKELEAVRSHLLAQIHDMGLDATVESEKLTIMDVWNSREARIAIKKGTKPLFQGAPSDKEKKLIEETIRQKAVFNANGELELKNILVKLDAPGTEEAVLFVSHYDTKDSTPGAADDMISVCAMLEALREQAKNSSLKKDLYFLFTDGEEAGAIGAEAFVNSHPELKDSIQLVVNFEARGNKGGLLMFQTSEKNYGLMRDFDAASSRPLAFSFTTALFRLMPNDTDLFYFLNAGYSGINFAAGEGVGSYHQAKDNFENLDRGTAHQFLQTALEMARFSGQGKFQNIQSDQDGIYFPVSSGRLLLLSTSVVYALSGLAFLAALGWVLYQFWMKKLPVRRLAAGTGWQLLMMIGMGLVSFGVVLLLTKVMKMNSESNSNVTLLWFMIPFGASILGAALFRMRKLSLIEAVAELLPLQLLLLLITTLFFKEISYLFIFSTFAAVIVAIFAKNHFARLTLSTILGVGMFLLYVPVCLLVYTLFMLPSIPVVIALSVFPLSFLAAFFASGELN